MQGDSSGDPGGGPRDSSDVRGEVEAALLELAARAGVEVRIEPFTHALAGRGGLCRVEGRPVILVDARLATLDRIGVLGEALGRALPRGTPVAPELAPYLTTGHAKVGRLARLRPLARGRR